MSTRVVIGTVSAIVGIAITIGHLVFAVFDRVPEKYHSHLAIVVTGFALMIGGLLLLGANKRR